MLQYDNEQIIELCSQVDLLEYASRTLDFEKRGESYFTNCPEHIDLTPSLSITPSKNLFHCFSCGRSGNILNWMMYYEGISFYDALQKLISMVDIDISKFKKADALILYKNLKFEQEIKNETKLDRKIFNENLLDAYQKDIPEEWLLEGIDPDIMRKYNIRIDHKSNRIIYPVCDKDFNLIGVKGRTRFINYKEMGIQKYQNYQKIGTTDFFIGMKENIENIKHKNEVIIFEGIKSGMKVEKWGYNNWIASETSYLNEEQIKILIAMKIKNIIIAFDNDVDISKIYECTKLLRKFTNVYYIFDHNKLLGEKENKMSPCDKGMDIWKTLYKERVKIK